MNHTASKRGTKLDYYKLRKIKKILKKVNRWKDHISQLTDQELQAKTIEFRQRLAQGETLDDLLPEAFAVAREADKRVLGMFPYDVQVFGRNCSSSGKCRRDEYR